MSASDFSSFALSPATREVLRTIGYTQPTPVQTQALPPALLGKDVIACAATGTGKTAAFVMPMVERLAGQAQHGIVGLVLAPTRELAAQLHTHARTFGAAHHLSSCLVIGGANQDAQAAALKRANIVIATPGRLVDFLKQGAVSLDRVQMLVLDEADRMLDMGFKPQLTRILARLPKRRQTLLFSATLGNEVEGFAKSALHEPVRISVTPSGTTASKADERAFHVSQGEKNALLLSLLAEEPDGKTVVFTRTKRRAEKLLKVLRRENHRAVQLHGDRSQNQRTHALDGFRGSSYSVLVTTDISARGLDVLGITHVVNFDVPFVPEDYVHRIGRTARNNASGQASTFVTPEDASLLRDIEKVTRHPVPRVDVPRTSPVFVKAMQDERARQSNPGPRQAPPPRPAGHTPGRHARTHRRNNSGSPR